MSSIPGNPGDTARAAGCVRWLGSSDCHGRSSDCHGRDGQLALNQRGVGKQLGTALAIPLLRCYDGTRGKWRGMGWLFYVYYPAHLALIGVLRVLLWGAGASTAAGSF